MFYRLFSLNFLSAHWQLPIIQTSLSLTLLNFLFLSVRFRRYLSLCSLFSVPSFLGPLSFFSHPLGKQHWWLFTFVQGFQAQLKNVPLLGSPPPGESWLHLAWQCYLLVSNPTYLSILLFSSSLNPVSSLSVDHPSFDITNKYKSLIWNYLAFIFPPPNL